MQQLLLIVTYTAQQGMREHYVNEVTASGILDTIRHEDGCLGYTYYYDAEDADKIILIEQWQSLEQQQVHMTQPHMTRLMAIKDRYIGDTQVRKGFC